MNKITSYCAIASLTILVGCAAPALHYYTLAEGAAPPKPIQAYNFNNEPVIYISRVTLPDYLNTTDITIRDGNALKHSTNGRMSSILSIGATGLITNILTDKNPNLWITNQSPVSPPNYQMRINIRRFDLQVQGDKTGILTLEASWSIIPQDALSIIQKQRTNFIIQGPVKTDSDTVKLEQNALIKLSNQINATIQQLR